MAPLTPRAPRPSGNRCRCTVEKSYLVIRRGRGRNFYARIQAACPHRTILRDFGNVRGIKSQVVREEMARYHTVLPSRLRARSAAETPSDDEVEDPKLHPLTGGGRRGGRRPDLSETESKDGKSGCSPLWDPKEPVGGGGLRATMARIEGERLAKIHAMNQERVDKACRKLLEAINGFE